MTRSRQKIKKKLLLSWMAVMAAFALAVGYGQYHNHAEAEFPSASDSSDSASTKAAAPTIKIIDNIYDALAREELLDQLSSITAEAEGIYGIYVLELDTGKDFGIKQDNWFTAASTTKVPILAKLYQEIQRGNVSSSKVMTFTEADYEEGTGSLQYSEFGTRWTVDELAEKMIKESDNVAKNMLFRLLGQDEIETFIYAQGSTYDLENNETTPRSMGNMLKQIYQNRIVSSQHSREMLDLMRDSAYETRLPLHLPDVPIAHKIGTWGNAVSDVGIILQQDHPFIICVYSEATGSLEEAEETIAMIAAKVYAFEANRSIKCLS